MMSKRKIVIAITIFNDKGGKMTFATTYRGSSPHQVNKMLAILRNTMRRRKEA